MDEIELGLISASQKLEHKEKKKFVIFEFFEKNGLQRLRKNP